MREIKFRAWEKNLREMIPVRNIDFEKKFINTASAWRIFDEVELMQYTGLKDKNGKEIYEGDVFESNEYGTFVVEWDMTSTGFYMRDPLFEGLDSIDADAHFSMELVKDGEVVGNIYEHPHLLEVKA